MRSWRRSSAAWTGCDRGDDGRRDTVNVLLVSTHPLADSYVAAVRSAAIAGLEAGGHVVDVADLDAERFDPCLSRREWEARRSRPGAADWPDNVRAHAARLQWADALVLVYPTWWGAQPAMLSGWLDRVWIDGVAYTGGRRGRAPRPGLRNIRHLVAITTHGSPKWINAVEGEPGKRVVLRRMRACCHPLVRTRWIALYDVDRSDNAQRQAFLGRVERETAELERITGARGRLRLAARRTRLR
jgi:putative NADPH-quinone reductase